MTFQYEHIHPLLSDVEDRKGTEEWWPWCRAMDHLKVWADCTACDADLLYYFNVLKGEEEERQSELVCADLLKGVQMALREHRERKKILLLCICLYLRCLMNLNYVSICFHFVK